MKAVIITRDEADAARAQGETPFTHAARKFKAEHGLDLKPEEIESGEDFRFEERNDGGAYRIIHEPRRYVDRPGLGF